MAINETCTPRIVIENNALDGIGDIVEGGRALIVADETTMRVAGDRVKKALEEKGIDVSVYFAKISDEKTVSEAVDAVKESGAEIVLGIGGGTCIDIAKLSSFRNNVPFISVPTSAAHDGICSPVASIKQADGLKSYPAKPPIAVVADILIIKNAPEKFYAAGVGDLIANFTAVADWELARDEKGDEFNEESAELSRKSAQAILEAIDSVAERSDEGVRIVMDALIKSGVSMCMAGSSRPCSGAEHLFSHNLDKIAGFPALHGAQCGVGAILMAKLHGLDWEKYKEVLEKVGAPTTAKELGVSEGQIVQALVSAHMLRDRYTILHKAPLNEEKAKELAKITGVI
ncbi:MAG: sn-glycerol-1-phosphate dehydrogenase [archaeon]